MKITVNGEIRDVADAVDLQGYLESLDLAALGSGIAVVLNGEVIRRGEWPRVVLKAHDEVEIVRPTVGG